jgi:hypothetical protein
VAGQAGSPATKFSTGGKPQGPTLSPTLMPQARLPTLLPSSLIINSGTVATPAIASNRRALLLASRSHSLQTRSYSRDILRRLCAIWRVCQRTGASFVHATVVNNALLLFIFKAIAQPHSNHILAVERKLLHTTVLIICSAN